MRTMRCTIRLLYHLILSTLYGPPFLMAGPTLDKLPSLSYTIQGHLKVAVLTNLLGWDDVMCSDVIDNINDMQYIIASLIGLEKVNSDPSLLGNTSLGLVFLEECDKAVAAVGQGLKMAPNTSYIGYSDEPIEGVVAAVGTATSGSTVALAPVLNLFDMALVSPAATTDELRDRVKYPNFYRLVPSDSFQTKVIIELMAELNWNYFSVIHSETSYGYNGVKFLRYHARRMGLCVADSYPIGDDYQQEDYDKLIQHLDVSHTKPHVVVIFAYSFQMREVVQMAHTYNMSGFIFILSEYGDAGTLAGLGDTTRGSFIVDWHISTTPEFRELVSKQTAVGHQSNPMFELVWRQFAGCDISHLPDDHPCLHQVFEDFTDFWFYTSCKLYKEAIEVIAVALHNLISSGCPRQLNHPTDHLQHCVQPELLIPFIKNATLVTDEGRKFFDEAGEMEINFRIRQMQEDMIEHVGTWEHESHEFIWFKSLKWHEGEEEIPDAVCSKPCLPGQFYIQGELPCCWECHPCRHHEYVANNATTCHTCPTLTWPHQVTYNSCVQIEAVYMLWTDVYGICLTSLATLGLIATLVIVTIMITHNQRRVVKGAVLSMTTIILVGELLAFSTVLLLIAKPHHIICYVNRVTFIFSCTLIYVPVLYKTLRVYLVFSASSKMKAVSKLAKTSSQYIMVSLTFILQIILLGVGDFYWPIEAVKTMPVPTMRYVELSCSQDQKGLVVPLSFNLLLIILSSVLAFLTRKLPDNFNESWYIFLSVSTTLFVWIAFLPTYYAAFYAYHKAALLALALSLNGIVTLLCLFAPKLYALYYIAETDIKITDFDEKSFEDKKPTQTKEI